ncbi:hypothetical protein [Actinacidiphila bryophytorum]|uniref:hypothetical protein n=1 Tax=Actinacidiphila bryophytorum TaxID=1436133 RepID=UPI002176B07A|nr:hypothetical protein [Actinacidiphila bryophytorum]UWE13341.1 hypothetical protein NYE86_34815 [Actinacidiphila bryophytorum]
MIKRAGFYQETSGPDAAGDAPSLRDAVRDTGPWDEDSVIAYLESALEVYSTMGAERDALTGDKWIAGAGSLLTDGTWIWPIDLAHYVRRHHAALPPEFLEHIRSRSYTVPLVDDERAREIFLAEFPNAAPVPAATSDGFFTWYLPKLTDTRARRLLGDLAKAGLSAVHPLTNSLFGFRETPTGARKPLPLTADDKVLAADLADEACSRVEFSCWKGYDQALTVIVRRTDESTQSVTVTLTGLPVPAREPTLAKLVSLPDRDPAGCRGFVVDLAGATAAEDWDGVLTGAGGPITVWPDTVGILRERVPEHPELTAGRRTPHGPLDVFHRP